MTYIPALLDPWAEWLAWQQTYLADRDPQGFGRRVCEDRLDRLLDCALSRSPLYAERARGVRRLQDLAPVGKQELMARFDEWATDRRITLHEAQAFLRRASSVAQPWLGSYQVWTSSGTSGRPGIFVQDRASLAAYDAMEALRLRGDRSGLPAMGPWTPRRRMAYVAAIGGPYAGHVSVERMSALLPPPWLPRIAKISVLLPLAAIARHLQSWQPDWLVTYPSCALALAELQAGGDLRLRLEDLWLGGEYLGPVQLRRLQQTFGCPVHNSYGASEAYSIACSCIHGRLHLNADWVILEPVDARRRPVATGVLSDMALLTNLANHAQPLLRYELPDRVRVMPDPCPCGNPWPVIEVFGRSDDALVLPARGGGTVTLLPLAVETALEEQTGIADFQLIACPDGALELRLPRSRGAATRARHAREALQHFLERHGAAPARVVLGRTAPQRQAGSGKLRRVIAGSPGVASSRLS